MCAHIPGNTADRNELTPQGEHPHPKFPFSRHREVPRHLCIHPLLQLSKPTACKWHCDCPCWSASLCTLSLVFFTGNKDRSDPTLQLCWLRGPATFSHILKPLLWPWGSWSCTFMPQTWLISYLLGPGGFYKADTLNRVSGRTVGGKCQQFPRSHMCLSATQLRVPAGMIAWSIAWVSPGAPAHWLFTLLLHQHSFPDPSLCKSHVFQPQQYMPFPKNTGKYICPLLRNNWVCLYSWVHVWRWGIELFTACLRPWWLNWDLLLYLPGRRGGGGWGRGKV